MFSVYKKKFQRERERVREFVVIKQFKMTFIQGAINIKANYINRYYIIRRKSFIIIIIISIILFFIN